MSEDEEEIILSTQNCSIKQSDIDTLKPHTYVNDLIISFYYEIIQDKYPSKLITLFAKDKSFGTRTKFNI